MDIGQENLGNQIPHFDRIVQAIRSGKCIPFLGAGVSLAYRSWLNGQCVIQGCPSGDELRKLLVNALQEINPTSEELVGLDHLPDLPSVAEFFHYFNSYQRSELEDLVRREIGLASSPRPIHWAVSGIPSIRCVFTTNYDELLEQAANSHARRRKLLGPFVYDQSLPEQQKPSNLPLDLIQGTRFRPPPADPDDGYPLVLYKMHGCVRHSDSMLITTNDYVKYIALWRDERRGMPKEFRDLLYKYTFLFLGYGLADWNFRVIWEAMITSFPNGKFEIDSYAIKKPVTRFESSLFKKLGIELIDCDLTLFARALAQEFKVDIPEPHAGEVGNSQPAGATE